MQRLATVLIILLLFLLPHHGAITVFAPDWMRWWKEGVLLLLGLTVILNLFQNLRNTLSKLPLQEGGILRSPDFYALLFLLWGAVLIALNPDPRTALIAFRYLGLGYVVYLIISCGVTKLWSDGASASLLHVFIASLLLSVLFGFWAQFLGGYEVLTSWYSNTISSWVPGQTIPLYHESDGIIRMQGTSSGPIEFSHLLVVGVYLLLFRMSYGTTKLRSYEAFKLLYFFTLLLFLLAIYFSHSRAAMIAVVILIFAKIIQQFQGADLRQFKIILSSTIIGLILSGVVGSAFAPSLLHRAGTSDHITKPIEAVKTGFEKPFTGHLGEWGPAARAKNLIENNDDKAPIAENVFADYFVQLGILGLLIGLGFLWSLWGGFEYEGRVFLITIFVLMNLATVLDMTPVSITFFFFLAFLYQSNINQQRE